MAFRIEPKCMDCKWFVAPMGMVSQYCTHELARDLVGNWSYAERARGTLGPCGPNAMLFELKPPSLWRRLLSAALGSPKQKENSNEPPSPQRRIGS